MGSRVGSLCQHSRRTPVRRTTGADLGGGTEKPISVQRAVRRPLLLQDAAAAGMDGRHAPLRLLGRVLRCRRREHGLVGDHRGFRLRPVSVQSAARRPLLCPEPASTCTNNRLGSSTAAPWCDPWSPLPGSVPVFKILPWTTTDRLSKLKRKVRRLLIFTKCSGDIRSCFGMSLMSLDPKCFACTVREGDCSFFLLDILLLDCLLFILHVS